MQTQNMLEGLYKISHLSQKSFEILQEQLAGIAEAKDN